MSTKSRVGIEKAFGHLGPNNPLKNLNTLDRELLVSLLRFYTATKDASGKGTTPTSDLEELARTLTEAKKLSEKLDRLLFSGRYAEPLREQAAPFAMLPSNLSALSTALGPTLDALGKPGHKEKNFSTHILVMASVFVSKKLGRPFDEHSAELFQAIGDEEFDSKDVSGDAIRKKREHLENDYPEMYADVLQNVETIVLRRDLTSQT